MAFWLRQKLVTDGQMKKSTKLTTGIGSGASPPPQARELNPGRPHDQFIVADTSKTMAAALTTPCHVPEQAQPIPITARGPPDQWRPWLLSDREVGIILGLSRATVWRRVSDGTLPKPVKIGGLTRWVSSEIEAVVLRAMAGRGEGS
jgi:predicted DNA-binding transcriptional regulator AlpA